jgi:hypothetical protein
LAFRLEGSEREQQREKIWGRERVFVSRPKGIWGTGADEEVFAIRRLRFKAQKVRKLMGDAWKALRDIGR